MSMKPDDSIDNLEERIKLLPRGSITKKTVKGQTYFYHRWSEKGVRKEKYIPMEELDDLKTKIEMRKKLERELKQRNNTTVDAVPSFQLNIITGSELKDVANDAIEYRKRDCFDSIKNYLFKDKTGKVLILYGLRRTGKTTLIKQALLEMDGSDFERSALIVIKNNNTISELNQDLITLRKLGYKYIFIDEVTLADNFIETSSILSDRFASGGMRIVLSGTDSLGFLFAEDDSLYDRCEMIHTTIIPFREFRRVLGETDIDDYIEYGGTMNPSGIDYNKNYAGGTSGQYVNSAIANNIQHSLSQYQYGGHFRNLQDLYDKGELTNVINRIVEDINHRFTLDVLNKDFVSNDYALAKNNLLKDDSFDGTVLNKINVHEVTEGLKTIMEILNRDEREVAVEEVHVQEIEEYLKLLDVTSEINVRAPFGKVKRSTRTIITQPGLRYAQADALIESLMNDDSFENIGKDEREYIEKKIRDSIRGRMMADIVLFETQMALPESKVFVLQFQIGEFDMVVEDHSGCKIYEIKHSDKAVPQQYRHLVDADKCRETEHLFGPIKERCVIYRGETHWENDIHYVNVEEYLTDLGKDAGNGSCTDRPRSGS